MENIIEFLVGLFGMVDIASVVAVFVLVWLWGELGLTGKAQLISSFLTGVVVGIAQRYTDGSIVGMQAWFQAVVYGIVLGGLASGAYEAIKGAIHKTLISTLEKEEIPDKK
jgi:hypothetical protein